MGMTMELLEVGAIDFGPLPEKDWAIRGTAQQKDGRKRLIACGQGLLGIPPHTSYLVFLSHLDKKYKEMGSEVRYEAYQVEDAKLILVSYGYPSRVCHEAVDLARAQGLKVGLIRPITLWPFPSDVIREQAQQADFLVVEDSLGQLVEDVKMAVEGRSKVHFLGVLARHSPMEMGLIFPEKVLEEAKKLL
jgi:2-oxoglutarate ferredoxin oxidoreductase subunit alpha